MAPIWSFDWADLAATHAKAGMAEVIDSLLGALSGAVALVMALEASLLTGVILPGDLVVLFAASTATTPTRLVVLWAAVAARLGGRGDGQPPHRPRAHCSGLLVSVTGWSPRRCHGPRVVRRLPGQPLGEDSCNECRTRVGVSTGSGAKPACSALEPGRPTGEHWGSGGRLVAELGAG
jgi:hypothetical protein